MMHLLAQKKLHSPQGGMLLDVELELERGQVIGLYGKSGAGKTSLLRIIAGLFAPDEAVIKFGEQTWVDTQKGIHLRPQERKIGFVFQDYALFPNMNVRQNLEFALQTGQDAAIVDELIAISELGQLQTQYPGTLSGGQQQRVALARSLVQRPQLLLLDEPLSAVDQEMRRKLQQHLLLLHRQFKLTTILISHDQQELEQMADQVILLEEGRVQQCGSPRDVFPSAENSAFLHGEIRAIEIQSNGAWVEVHTQNQRLKLWVDTTTQQKLALGQMVEVNLQDNQWKVLK